MDKMIVMNFSRAGSALVRIEVLDNVEWAVAPGVFLVEGVHHGSGGAVYYPADVIARSVESWNMKPVYVGHPEIDGAQVGGSDLRVLDMRIGFLRGMTWENGKLKGEVWVKKEKQDMLRSMIDVSTGMFIDVEDVKGAWNGEKYDFTATNIRTDHLALLPHERGACSIEDGAGCPRLNSDHNTNKENEMPENTVVPAFNMEESMAKVLGAISALDGRLNVLESATKEAIKCGNEEVINACGGGKVKNAKNAACEKCGGAECDGTCENKMAACNAEHDPDTAEALTFFKAAKAEMVAGLVGNSKCKYAKEELEVKTMRELGILADMVKTPVMVGNAMPQQQGQAVPAISPLPSTSIFSK